MPGLSLVNISVSEPYKQGVAIYVLVNAGNAHTPLFLCLIPVPVPQWEINGLIQFRY
jgi:hypothetical protein